MISAHFLLEAGLELLFQVLVYYFELILIKFVFVQKVRSKFFIDS